MVKQISTVGEDEDDYQYLFSAILGYQNNLLLSYDSQILEEWDGASLKL